MWAASDTEAGDGKPVMVWLHGGAYILGSSAQSLYHGGALASGGDALIVTVNYRLGALGFLDLSSFGAGFSCHGVQTSACGVGKSKPDGITPITSREIPLT